MALVVVVVVVLVALVRLAAAVPEHGLVGETAEVLTGHHDLDIHPGRLSVVMVVGVNGSGKTTSIGKLANRLIATGYKVSLANSDTFRAAASEQLAIWADRTG